MRKHLDFIINDGIKCYSPQVCKDYSDYPDIGFDLTEGGLEGSFWVTSRNRLFKSILLKYISVSGKTKLLEIGCNTGDFIGELVKNDRLEITGSEIYYKGLHYAKKKYPGVEFVQLDISEGAINKKFDIITAFDVIEHIENDADSFFNIGEMLPKGGLFVMSVPQYMFLWSSLDVLVKHKRRYSKSDLWAKLTASGFSIEYQTSYVFFLFPLMLISRAFDKRNTAFIPSACELDKRVRFNKLSNFLLGIVMRIDEFFIKLGLSLPFGGTLVVVARKR